MKTILIIAMLSISFFSNATVDEKTVLENGRSFAKDVVRLLESEKTPHEARVMLAQIIGPQSYDIYGCRKRSLFR